MVQCVLGSLLVVAFQVMQIGSVAVVFWSKRKTSEKSNTFNKHRESLTVTHSVKLCYIQFNVPHSNVCEC